MTKSLVRKVANLARPIPFQPMSVGRGGLLRGQRSSDRLLQLEAMGGTGTLYAIIQLLSTGTSAHGWQMFKKITDGRRRYAKTDVGSDQREEVIRHPALSLWDNPNEFWTGEDFREMGWQFMELVGEWYWILNRGPSGKGLPIEIWTVRPDRMEPVSSEKNFLAGWTYTAPSGEVVPLSTSEVIQLRYPHPTDFYRGMSAVQALLADIDSARFSAEWSRNFFMNSATPGGIIQFSKRLSEPEYREFTQRWREQHQGISRGHRVGILEQGATWYPNTYTIREMQFRELRDLSREVIREAYRIHQSMLGLSNDVNRANAQTAEEVHIGWHEVPRLRRMRSVLNKKLLPMYKDTANEFDFANPVTQSQESAVLELTGKANAAAALVKAGWNEDDVLTTVGLPPMRYSGGIAAPAQRPAIGNPDNVPGYLPQDVPPVQDLLTDFNDEEIVAISNMIRDSFRIRARNGHRKELVAGSVYE